MQRKVFHPRTGSVLLAIPLFVGIMLSAGCSGVTGMGGSSTSKAPSGAIALTPATPAARLGASVQFAAKVTGPQTTTVTWTVGGVAGGNATLGTIDKNGLYRTPAKLPSPNIVTIEAISVSDSKLSASTMITLQNPVPKISSVSPASLAVGNFSLTVNGSNFVSGAVVVWNGQFLATTFVSATQLKATGTAASTGQIKVMVTNPDPGSASSDGVNVAIAAPPPGPPANPVVSAQAAARFLEQSTWGPTPALVANIQTVGFDKFLDAQFAAPATTYPATGKDDGVDKVQSQFFVNALTGNDQVRQRVAFALSEIMVVSAVKVNNASAHVLWQNMFQKDAFGNFSTLLTDVTLSPSMGNYLDMVNNDKPNPAKGTAPNENYAREVLQLFTIGLQQLNPDGTPQLDSSGNPIPTYGQDEIIGFAHAFTGWTYPTTSGTTASFPNSPNYTGPMIAFDSHHDTGTKTLLNGMALSAGGSAQGDLTAALQNIVNHPNVGPFIGKQLIQHLVTSNPSPDYISRITAVFNDNGQGVRGDLKAMVKAILLDPEARRGDDAAQVQADDGHLKEPLLFMMNLLRAANVTSDGKCLADFAARMKQNPMFSPTVFNFFHPDAMIPNTNLLGPEFEILDGASSLNRINFVNSLMFGTVCDTTKTDVSSYVLVANDANQLLDTLAAFMLHGQVSNDTRTVLSSALETVTDTTKRVKTAMYLIGSSSQFQVEH